LVINPPTSPEFSGLFLIALSLVMLSNLRIKKLNITMFRGFQKSLEARKNGLHRKNEKKFIILFDKPFRP